MYNKSYYSRSPEYSNENYNVRENESTAGDWKTYRSDQSQREVGNSFNPSRQSRNSGSENSFSRRSSWESCPECGWSSGDDLSVGDRSGRRNDRDFAQFADEEMNSDLDEGRVRFNDRSYENQNRIKDKLSWRNSENVNSRNRY